MPRLTCEITFYADGATEPALRLVRGVERISARQAQGALTATATIEIARTWRVRGTPLRNLIRRGMAVRIRCGYEFRLVDEFVGYVARVSPSDPMRIECEDTMFKLKKPALNHTFENTTVQGVLDWLGANGMDKGRWWKGKMQVYDNALGRFRLTNLSPAGTLRYFGDDLHLRAFFRNDISETGVAEPVLVIGQVYTSPNRRRVPHSFQRTILPGHGLEFVEKEDVKLLIHAYNHLPDGSTEEYKTGDEGGDSRTLNFYNTPDFKKLADEKARTLRYDGYKGSFSTFGGDPTGRTLGYVQQADIIDLTDDDFPDRTGAYYVAGTEMDFGTDGYTRKIELGEKA